LEEEAVKCWNMAHGRGRAMDDPTLFAMLMGAVFLSGALLGWVLHDLLR
jgi:hypothetical protein